jgi:hypothetical protein
MALLRKDAYFVLGLDSERSREGRLPRLERRDCVTVWYAAKETLARQWPSGPGKETACARRPHPTFFSLKAMDLMRGQLISELRKAGRNGYRQKTYISILRTAIPIAQRHLALLTPH